MSAASHRSLRAELSCMRCVRAWSLLRRASVVHMCHALARVGELRVACGLSGDRGVNGTRGNRIAPNADQFTAGGVEYVASPYAEAAMAGMTIVAARDGPLPVRCCRLRLLPRCLNSHV